MERKTLHKRKGQWVTLSTSIIVASLAVSSGSVLAEEVDFTRGSSTIYGNSQLQASDSSNEIHPVEEDESLQAEQEETRQETQADLTSGDHHKDVSQRDLLAYVVAQEAGSNSQEGIDAVLSTIYNRADANNSSAYEEITKPYQFTAYGSEAWRKRQNEDLTKVYASIDKHEAGTRTHQYQNFLASNYFYNSPEWKGHKNAANADLSSYVSSKQDIGGNTFFTPSSNFPYKKAETVEKENAPVRSRNQSLYKNTEGYQVKPGDTLYSIAKRNNLSVDQLKNLNHLTSNMLRSGQVLKVSNGQASSTFPAKKETSKPAHSRATKAGQTPAKTVTVKKGEYLYLIAQRHGLSVDQLKAMNKLTSNVLHSGQVLRVSNGQAPSSSPVKKETSKPTHSRATKAGQTPAKTVTVKKGEYLYLIAQRHGLSVDQLKAMNKLTSNVLHSGQVLRVSNGQAPSSSPVKKETSKPTHSRATKAGQTPAKTVTVKKGEYLYLIAQRHGLSVDQLKAMNKLTSNVLHSGQVLRVSNGQAPSSSPVKKETSKPTHSRATKAGQTPAKTVTVKKGEYLYLIAQRHGLSVDQLKAMNKLTSNVLHSGQVLKVSNGSTSRVNKEKIQNPKPSETGQETKKDIIKKQAKTVTVQRGDYLYKIARENGLTVDQLKTLNNLSSNIVYAGQVLKLDQGTTYSPITNPKPGQTAPSNEKLPNLANANSRQVNYDVKLNSKNEPLRKSLSSNAGSVNSVSYFGQRFTVTRELNQEGQKFLELTQNGQVIGYVRSNAAVQVPQGQKVIYLDAGHGGSETGAYSFGVAEKNLNLNITRQLSNLLRGQGYKVIESRTNDVAIPLKQRTVQSNQIMPDLYISVHHNAMPQNKRGTSAGIETLYHNSSIDEPGYMTPSHHKYTNLQSEDKRLASIIQSNLVQSTGAVNRGTRAENLHVTRTSDVPSVLVELGFQDNASEFKKLTSPAYQTRLVRGLLNGINQYLN